MVEERLTSWLNDALALETQLAQVLESQSKHASDDGEIRRGIESHLQETRRHAELVEGCLERLGTSPSKTKPAMGKMMGMVQGPSTAMAADTLVKDLISDYAAEHAEIASYRALIDASRQAGQEEIATTCEQILREEERMAAWLEEQLPKVVSHSIAEVAQR